MKTINTLNEPEIRTIPEGWENLELKKFAVITKEGYLPNGDASLPYIGLEHIDQQTLSLNSIGESSDVTSNKFLFRSGDILFGKLRPYFRKVYRPNFSGICSTDIWVARAKDGFDQGWLFYLFASEDFINSASGGSSGTRMPRADWNHLKDTIWPVPKPSEQKQIAEILSSLDDKIELNRKINNHLEKLVSALFKKWFADIENELPDGWSVEKIGDLKLLVTDHVANGSFAALKENVSKIYEEENYALFVRNTDLKNKFSTKRYVDKKAYDFLSKTHLSGGEVIISNVADVGSVYKCPRFKTPMVLGNNVIMLNGKLLNNYLYFYFSSPVGQSAIRSITSGSAQLKFNKTDFRNLEISKPTDDILGKLDGICEGIFKMIQNNEDEINNLSIIRDSLLPRLMNGKIRVNI